MMFSRIAMNSKRVAIDYRGQHANQKDSSSTAFKSSQRPKQEFIDALDAFKPFVQKLLGFSPRWMSDVAVTAVHISEQPGDRRGVVISCKRTIPDTTAPFNFSTPLMIEQSAESEDESNGRLVWPEGFDEALTAIQAQASKYIANERGQGDLFEGPVTPSEHPSSGEEVGGEVEDHEPVLSGT
jgi:hypothetical protein